MMSKKAVITFTAVLALLLLEVVHLLADRPEHFEEIYAGAIQSAYPEYFIGQGSRASFNPISTGFEIGSSPYGRTKPGETSASLNGSVSVDVTRRVSWPELPPTRMTPLLESFGGGQGMDAAAKNQARSELFDLSDDTFANAIIELASPLSEKQLRNSFADLVHMQGDSTFLFLSGIEEGMTRPVYWRACAVYKLKCETTSSLELYRRWTSRIAWLDRIGLRQLGLDLDHLQQSAREGRIYGLLTYGYPKPKLLEILNRPEVRTIRIARTWTW
ncbi:hypothetical protein [Nonomuraea sp. B1E8]|uniref:hypothetical protein n=1 Tax=unclassified Nonomuraea TaxID=2593643 RepID=UPI00325D694F